MFGVDVGQITPQHLMMFAGLVVAMAVLWLLGMGIGSPKSGSALIVGTTVAGMIICGFGAVVVDYGVTHAEFGGLLTAEFGILTSLAGLVPALIGGGAAWRAALRQRPAVWAAVLPLCALFAVLAFPIGSTGILGYAFAPPAQTSVVPFLAQYALPPLVLPVALLVYVLMTRARGVARAA